MKDPLYNSVLVVCKQRKCFQFSHVELIYLKMARIHRQNMLVSSLIEAFEKVGILL